MIVINVISQTLHFVQADTMKMYKMYTISFLYAKNIIMPETICMFNKIFMLDLVNIDTNL